MLIRHPSNNTEFSARYEPRVQEKIPVEIINSGVINIRMAFKALKPDKIIGLK